MADLRVTLMKEFYTLHKEALARTDYPVMNTFLLGEEWADECHGLSAAEVVSFMKRMIDGVVPKAEMLDEGALRHMLSIVDKHAVSYVGRD